MIINIIINIIIIIIVNVIIIIKMFKKINFVIISFNLREKLFINSYNLIIMKKNNSFLYKKELIKFYFKN